MMHDKYNDACILSMLECFLEAAPQLTIQVYILLQHRNDETLLTGTTIGTGRMLIIPHWALVRPGLNKP